MQMKGMFEPKFPTEDYPYKHHYENFKSYIKKLNTLAEKRKKSLSTTRAMNEDRDILGAAGELEFSRVSGYRMPIVDGGDGGVDFRTNMGTIDVKTALDPKMLFLEVGKKEVSEIYVLAGFSERERVAYLLGWEYYEVMLGCPKKTYVVENHVKPREKLRPMHTLIDALYPFKIYEWLQLRKIELEITVDGQYHAEFPLNGTFERRGEKIVPGLSTGKTEREAVVNLFLKVNDTVATISKSQYNLPDISEEK